MATRAEAGEAAAPVRDTLTQYLVLRQLAKDVNVRLSSPLDLDTKRPFQGLSVSNARGVVAVATQDGA